MLFINQQFDTIVWGIPKQQKMKNWSQTAEYLLMLQSDRLIFQIELNSLSGKRVSDFVGIIIIR